MLYAALSLLLAASVYAQCPVPTVEKESFNAQLLSSSGLSLLGGTTLLTLDISFSKTHNLDTVSFKECVDDNGDRVVFQAYNMANPAGTPQVTNGNVEVLDPNNNCQKTVTVSIDYLTHCNFNVEDSADGETTTFSGELTLKTKMDFTEPFEFTRNNERPMLFFITFDRTFEVTTSIEVKNPNQCEDSSDCNGYPCIMFPTEGIKKCNCTNQYGSNQGNNCEVDATCPTFTNCPNGTVTVVPLVTALPGHLSQVLSNIPSYNDNQLTGQIKAYRTINGVETQTSPTGTDDLLSYNFPLGVTSVSYRAADEVGNECECNFQVNVTDALAPIVLCPPDQITNTWGSWAEPSGSDLIDSSIHFWSTVTMGAYTATVTTTTTAAPTTTTTAARYMKGVWDCNCASILGDANLWSTNSQSSYIIDSVQGDIKKVDVTSVSCPTLYTASDLSTAGFLVSRVPNAHTAWAFTNTVTFQKLGFGKMEAVYHGTYCPTVDPNFWYNAAVDGYIWYNSHSWHIGKPSVAWIATSTASHTCETVDQAVCSGASLNDNCAPMPCLNGGTCVDQVNGYSCTCATGFDGATCSNNINDCAPMPCLNGGTCVDQVNGYSCTCAPGFDGATCSNFLSPLDQAKQDACNARGGFTTRREDWDHYDARYPNLWYCCDSDGDSYYLKRAGWSWHGSLTAGTFGTGESGDCNRAYSSS